MPRILSITTKALGALIALASVLLVASQALGGPVSLVMTHGSSMAPRLHDGDLVFVGRGGYEPGDVVAYRSTSLKAVVLHRIVRTEGDRFVFKGDNNEWLDSERPTRSELLGKQMLRIPAAGKVVGALRTPGGISVAAAAAAPLALMRVLVRKRSRSRGRDRRPAILDVIPSRQRSDRPARGTQIALGGGAALFIALSAGAFLLPAVRGLPATLSFKHTGAFAYSARVPAGPVYEDREITTRDPVYLKLVPSLDVSFAYRFRSDAPHAIRKRARLAAEVSDDTGWKRTIEIQPASESDGDEAVLQGRLDLDKIWRLIDEVQRLTGMRTDSYSLALVPSVHVTGTVGGKPIEAEFTPRLPLRFDRFLLRPVPAATPDGGTATEPPPDPREPSQQGSVKLETTGHPVIALGGIRLDAPAARKLGISGALAFILALAFVAFRARTGDGERDDEAARILRRHHEWIVPVSALSPRAGDSVVDVTSIANLLRLADRCGRMILHEEGAERPAFLVEDEGTTYRYVTRSATAPHTSRGSATEGSDDAADVRTAPARAGEADA